MADAPDIMAVCRPHVGLWRGRYRHFDTDGVLVDDHASEIINAFPESGPYAYVQTSRFLWDDGRAEEHVFPGVLRENRLHWSTERLNGTAFTTADAPHALFLRFARVDLPGIAILEMIELDEAQGIRMRSWQWRRDGVPFRRTLVDERRISR
ncbi:MAG: hypothetical protein CFE37_00040 [Alphaproteobacteria bacterium PA4]|nr:MAG: hypothetical protein CFE37_00040 [Alphaproteobacteria bacterium PA4]